MKANLSLVTVAALLVALAIIGSYGVGAVLGAFLAAGWSLLLVCAFHLLPLTCAGLAWQKVASGLWGGPPGAFVLARWIREGVNDLLPVAQIGGQVAGARVLTLRGAPPAVAGASVIVDLTIRALTQVFFILLALLLLVREETRGGETPWLLVGTAVTLLPAFALLVAQRWGLFYGLERALLALSRKTNWTATGSVEGLDAAAQALYQPGGRLLAGTLLHAVSLCGGALWTWLALFLMGHPVTFRDAVILEGLILAVKTAAFAVPGALGAQELGYLALGSAVGLSPEPSLAFSLVRRVRDWLLGILALVAWHVLEVRRLSARGSSQSREATDARRGASRAAAARAVRADVVSEGRWRKVSDP